MQNRPLICFPFWALTCTSFLHRKRPSLDRGNSLPFHTNSAAICIWLAYNRLPNVSFITSRFCGLQCLWHLSRSDWRRCFHWQPTKTSLNVMTNIFPIILPNPCTSNNSDKICSFSIEDKAVNFDQITAMAVLPRKHFTNKESSLYRSKIIFHCQFKRVRSFIWFRPIIKVFIHYIFWSLLWLSESVTKRTHKD